MKVWRQCLCVVSVNVQAEGTDKETKKVWGTDDGINALLV